MSVKEEFCSCLSTGVISFLVAVSVIMGSYYLTKENKKNIGENQPKKIYSAKNNTLKYNQEMKQR